MFHNSGSNEKPLNTASSTLIDLFLRFINLLIYFDKRNRFLNFFFLSFFFLWWPMPIPESELTLSSQLVRLSADLIRSLKPVSFWYPRIIFFFNFLLFICLFFYFFTCWWIYWTPRYKIFIDQISETRSIFNNTCGPFASQEIFF